MDDVNLNLVNTVFCITASMDYFIRQLSEKKIRIFGIEKSEFVVVLEPYFKEHTALASACIAGFVGALVCICIQLLPIPESLNTLEYAIVAWLCSVVLGMLLRSTPLFPHLKRHYYDRLGKVKSFLIDSLLGLTVVLILYIVRSI